MDLFSESEGSSSRSSSVEADDVDAGSGADFNINKEYAARFEHNKQRTELQQLEEKHGKNVDSTDESSSEEETEDEEGEQITADVDAAILTTLAKIRRKDESIYEAGKRVFDEERQLISQSKLLPRTLTKGGSSKERVTLADYQRSRIQELIKTSEDPARALADATMIQRRQDGGVADDEDGGSGPLTHTKEQEQLRREVTSAFHSMGEGGADDFFTKKEGALEEGDGDDDPESYRKFLLGVLGGKDKEEAVREILRAQTAEASAGDAPMPARGQAPKVRVEDATEQENEEFLMNYVLNRGWVENPSAAPKARQGVKVKADLDVVEEKEGFSDVSSEDSFDSRAEAFENAYNFRFEELEGGEAEAQIQSYARNPIGSVRRKEDKRKKEREERAKRKELEKDLKKKQIDRLRDLKRKSIVERLKVLKEATGSSNVDFERFQLDDDFDPEEHDRLMQKAFNDEYYGEQEDSKKPKWNDDLDLGDVVEGSKNKKAKKGKGKEEDAIEMDADFIDNGMPVQEKKLSKAEKKKLKKREKAKARKQGEAETNDVDDVEMDAEREVEVDHNGSNFGSLNAVEKQEKMKQAMDEYYGLEYEDMIGDQPTRFKYTQVPQSTFGLTPEEILLADDDELQGIVNLKRLQPYREGREKPSDLNKRVKEFRRRFEQSREGQQQPQPEGDGEEEKSKTKRMGKKERQRRKEAAERKAQEEASAGGTSEPPKKKSKKSVT